MWSFFRLANPGMSPSHRTRKCDCIYVFHVRALRDTLLAPSFLILSSISTLPYFTLGHQERRCSFPPETALAAPSLPSCPSRHFPRFDNGKLFAQKADCRRLVRWSLLIRSKPILVPLEEFLDVRRFLLKPLVERPHVTPVATTSFYT